jgi:hypothetical protein
MLPSPWHIHSILLFFRSPLPIYPIDWGRNNTLYCIHYHETIQLPLFFSLTFLTHAFCVRIDASINRFDTRITPRTKSRYSLEIFWPFQYFDSNSDSLRPNVILYSDVLVIFFGVFQWKYSRFRALQSNNCLFSELELLEQSNCKWVAKQPAKLPEPRPKQSSKPCSSATCIWNSTMYALPRFQL